MSCAQSCGCITSNTETCDRIDGTCSCKTGYEGDVCSGDVNECTLVSTACSAVEDCVNLVGSFRCDCKTGYSKSNGVCEGTFILHCQSYSY